MLSEIKQKMMYNLPIGVLTADTITTEVIINCDPNNHTKQEANFLRIASFDICLHTKCYSPLITCKT